MKKSKKRKVFVINKSSHDFSKAAYYGELVFLSEGLVDKFKTNNIYRLFQPKLSESSPSDLILVTGLTVMNIIACSIFVSLHGKLNLLIYDDNRRTYKKRQLTITN